MGNFCRNCKYCKSVYRNKVTPIKYRMHYCEKHEELIKTDGTCKDYITRKSKIDLSDRRFKKVLKQLQFLIDYYEKH